jgi:signal transduction histidine kinase
MDLTFEQKDNLILMGTLMKGVAHNINTPLSAIMGLSEILQFRVHKLKESYGNELNGIKEEFDKIEKDLSIILQNSERVSHIVRNAAQKCINEQASSLQQLNLSLLLKEEISFLEADMMFKHRIEKICHLNEALPLITGVYSHFSYSFYHLLENSKRAMETSELKQLTVSSDYDVTNIIIKIHDTGCGFDQGTREELVNYLNDSADSNKMSINMNGGMAVIKTLLQPYQPVFDISSSPGNTTFAVLFPLHN